MYIKYLLKVCTYTFWNSTILLTKTLEAKEKGFWKQRKEMVLENFVVSSGDDTYRVLTISLLSQYFCNLKLWSFKLVLFNHFQGKKCFSNKWLWLSSSYKMRHLSVLILSIQLIKTLDRNDDTYRVLVVSLSWSFCNLKLEEFQVQNFQFRNCQFGTFSMLEEFLSSNRRWCWLGSFY